MMSRPIAEDASHRMRRLSRDDSSDDRNEEHNSAAMKHKRKLSNSDLADDLRHLSLNSATHRERSNTLLSNQLIKYRKAKKSSFDHETEEAGTGHHSPPHLGGDGNGTAHHHSQHCDSAVQSHDTSVAGKQKHATAAHGVTASGHGATHFRERSNTMPSVRPIVTKRGVEHQKPKEERRSPNRGSSSSSGSPEHDYQAIIATHSNTPSSAKTGSHIQYHLAKAGETTSRPPGNAAGSNKRPQTFSDSNNINIAISADDILDNYIKQATAFRQNETLPAGSDVFEELRNEDLSLEDSLTKTDAKATKSTENKPKSTNAKQPSSKAINQRLQNIIKPSLQLQSSKDNNGKITRPNHSSAPNSPGLARRVHFQ